MVLYCLKVVKERYLCWLNITLHLSDSYFPWIFIHVLKLGDAACCSKERGVKTFPAHSKESTSI